MIRRLMRSTAVGTLVAVVAALLSVLQPKQVAAEPCESQGYSVQTVGDVWVNPYVLNDGPYVRGVALSAGLVDVAAELDDPTESQGVLFVARWCLRLLQWPGQVLRWDPESLV